MERRLTAKQVIIPRSLRPHICDRRQLAYTSQQLPRQPDLHCMRLFHSAMSAGQSEEVGHTVRSSWPIVASCTSRRATAPSPHRPHAK